MPQPLLNSLKVLSALLLGIFMLTGLSISTPQGFAQEEVSPQVKGVNPARKRGIEYGFDRGYLAGKTDKKEGLKPDPKRHEDFTKPERYWRSEFGSQAGFVRGFKGGFVGGYQKAFGKKVRVKVQGSYTIAPGDSGRTVKPKSKPLKQPSAASDAL